MGSQGSLAGGRRGRRAFAVALALSALATFHPALSGRVLGGGMIDRPPFEAYAVAPENHLLLDIESHLHPFVAHVARELRAGRVALWNPYAGLGVPMLANEQSAALHPVTLLAVMLSWRAAMHVMAVCRFLLAFAGMWLLARDRGTSPEGAGVAAAGYVLTGRVVDFMSHPVYGVFGHLPLLCLLARKVGRGGTLGARLGLVVLLASSVLAGHFEYLPLVWGIAFAAGLGTAPRGARIRALCALLALFAAGALLASVMILPGVEYLERCGLLDKRVGGSGEGAPEIPEQLPAPDGVANRRMVSKAANPAAEKGSGSVLAMLPERNLVVPTILVLAAAGMAARGGLGLGLLALLGAAVASGVPVVSKLWELPVLKLTVASRLAFPVSVLVGLLAGAGLDAVRGAAGRRRGVAGAIAGALVAGVLIHPLPARGALVWASALLCAGATAVGWQGRRGLLATLLIAGSLVAGAPWLPTLRQRWELPSRIFPDLPELRDTVALAGHERVAGWHGVLPPTLSTVVGVRDVRVLDGLWTGRLAENRKWAAEAPSLASRQVGVRHVLMFRVPEWRRVDEPRGALLPGEPLGEPDRLTRSLELAPGFVTALSLHVASVGRRGPPHLAASLELPSGQELWSLEIASGEVPAAGWLDVAVDPPVRGGRTAVLALEPRGRRGGIVLSQEEGGALAVKVERHSLPLPLVPGGTERWAIARDDRALPRARLEGRAATPVAWLEDEPTHLLLEVDAPAPDRLVVADRCYPGWTARRDGAPVLIDCDAKGEQRRVELPAGRHLIEMSYEPPSYRIGLFLTCATLAALACVPALRLPRSG